MATSKSRSFCFISPTPIQSFDKSDRFRTSVTLRRPTNCSRPFQFIQRKCHLIMVDGGKGLADRLQVMELLQRDLRIQYEAPRSLDWSLYDDDITFDDPATKLSGKRAYKGMLLTIGLLIIPIFFHDAKFFLNDCRLTEDGKKIRTAFETIGTTRWGTSVKISGIDHFWFATDSAKVVRHQSEWDQTPEDIGNSFFRNRLKT